MFNIFSFILYHCRKSINHNCPNLNKQNEYCKQIWTDCIIIKSIEITSFINKYNDALPMGNFEALKSLAPLDLL